MSALKYIVKYILVAIVDKYGGSVYRWAKRKIEKAQEKKANKKTAKELDNAKSKKDYADRLNDLP